MAAGCILIHAGCIDKVCGVRLLYSCVYMLSTYYGCFLGENCIFGTSNNALRRFRTPNIDFVKITLETLDS